MHTLLLYDLADDYLERRGPLREAHLALAREAHADGRLVLAGALSDPADQAVLVFSTEDTGVAEEFARHDPYVEAGLVTAWRVRPWNVVVG
ncbi:MAG TPA: YciI-like protein [Acidimicrobiales bacterium]